MKLSLLIIFAASFCWGQTPAAVQSNIDSATRSLNSASSALAALPICPVTPPPDPLDAIIDAASPDIRTLLASLLKGLVGLSITNLVGDTTVPATPPLELGSFFLYIRKTPTDPLPISTPVVK